MSISRRLGPVSAPMVLAACLLAGPGPTSSAAPGREPRQEDPEEEAEVERLEDRANWFFLNHKGPDGAIPRLAHLKALKALEANEKKGLLAARPAFVSGNTWESVGPTTILSNSIYSGRVTSLAIHPSDPNTIYVGASIGGVWKTIDGGGTWAPLTDDQSTLAIGSLAIDPSNAATIYAGTGEADGNCDSYFGTGILKSTDAGVSWSLIASTPFAGTSVARIIVHPSVSTTLWAANATGFSGRVGRTCSPGSGAYGVWKSIDAGASWTLVLGPSQTGASGDAHDLVIDPTNPSILYAAADGSGIWKSIDGGATWTQLAGGLPAADIGRGDLAIDPNNASRLFAVFSRASTGAALGVWRTIDSGTTWTQAVLPTSILCNNYCWFCLTIEVAPDGSVWLGGILLWRSVDAGSTWTVATASGLHADHHALAFTPGKTWSGNDGGIFASTDSGASWTSKTAGMALTQFYPGASLDPNSLNLMLGGAQDNGSNRYTGTPTWTTLTGNDGAFTAIDPTHPTTVQYTSYQYLNIFKTTNGTMFASTTTGLTDSGTTAASFIAPFVMCPRNPSVLIAASDNVWRTNDAAAGWASNSPEGLSGGNAATAIAFAPSDPACNTYFVGFIGGGVYRTTSGGGTTGWTSIGSGLPNRVVSDLAVHPTNPNILYVTYSGFGPAHVYRTIDALSASPTWTAIDNGIPDTPALAILLDPADPGILYLGNDLGLFRSIDGGASWQIFMNGHPNVPVYDLVGSNEGASQIVSFTHGRGAFRIRRPHASSAGATIIDVCAYGGAGSGNGIVDAGETVTTPVTLVNEGPDPLSSVSGVLTSPSAGVAIQDGAATWPDIAASATAQSNPDHFTFAVAPGTACGARLDFDLALTYAEGSNTTAFPVTVGHTDAPPPTPINEPFAGTTPAGWTVVDMGTQGGGTWTGANPCARSIGSPFAGSWEIVDSACAGATATQDEQLITPAFDTTSCLSLNVSFSNQFHWKQGGLNEFADVDVSTNGGGTWTNIIRMWFADDGYPTPNTKTLDLTALAAGQPSVKIRFRYANGKFEYWWAIDNVVVSCEVLVCTPCAPSPPGEAGLAPPLAASKVGGNLDLTWGASGAGCGGTDYAVYQGSLASLHGGAYDHAAVVCSTGGTASYSAAMPAGSGLYFLVTSMTVAEEGSYGRRSGGAERPPAASACRAASNLASCF